MKKFMQAIAAVKTVAAFAFTAQIMLVTVVSMFLGEALIPIGYVWQMIFLSLIFGILHLHAFSEHESKKVGFIGRMALIGVPMFIVLAAFAFFFEWFPVYVAANWLIFKGLYIAVFLIAVVALRTAFRLSGIKYNEMLAAYKAGRGN